MRIPFEGMLAAASAPEVPLIVSVWGNDFTLHASSTPLMHWQTKRTVRRIAALHADCRRDVRLASEWGLEPGTPSLVIPGNGGVRKDLFYPDQQPARDPVVLNPRGPRVYVRNDSFFRAIPLVLARRPEARFLCAAMAGDMEAARLVRLLSIGHAVELLEPVPHERMGSLYRRAQVLVSPSIHDGTPNTMLEGMACGCFPVMGDLESVREWITNGRNGLLVDAGNPESIAEAILVALDREDLRREAAGLNSKLIATRADFSHCMAKAAEFYELAARA
jgi:glycosyltransferase involved in cell wall biosynthesis